MGSGKAVIRTLSRGNALLTGKVTALSLIGHAGKLPYRQTKNGLEITLPQQHVGIVAHVFKVN